MATNQYLVDIYNSSFKHYYPLYHKHYFDQYLRFYQQASGLAPIVDDPTWTSGPEPECTCTPPPNCEERLSPSSLDTNVLRRSLGSIAKELDIV